MCNVMVYVPRGVEDEVVMVTMSVIGELLARSKWPLLVVPVDA